jgi:hypothetical protein
LSRGENKDKVCEEEGIEIKFKPEECPDEG